MNKLQLVINTIEVMKAKESIAGKVQVEGSRDELKIFSLNKEFTKDKVTGVTQLKLNTEFDWEGQKIKHESSTEFNMKDCSGRMCRMHGMHRHFHDHIHSVMGCRPDEHREFPEHFPHGMHHHGMRCGLNKVLFLLKVFNEAKLEEKADGAYELSLTIKEIPEELKRAMQDRCNQEGRPEPDEHAKFLRLIQELHSIENPVLTLNVLIDKDYEVKKAIVNISGKGKDENGGEHELNFRAELGLA